MDVEDGTGRLVEGSWRDDDTVSGLHNLGTVGSNRYGLSAADIREIYTDYFNSEEGEIHWQYNVVNRSQ